MDVNIDVGRVYIEVDKIRNLLACGDELFIGVHDGFVEVKMPHVAPVDKEVLVCSLFAGGFRFGDESGYFHQAGFYFYTEQLLVHLFAKHRHDALAQGHDGQIEYFGIVAVKIECHLRVY